MILLLLRLPAAAAAEAVTIFAAASTTDAVTEIAELYETRSGQAVRRVFAASSTLARQIAQGAPADLYLSANPRWMDYLEGQDLIAPGSRLDLLGNSLVLIAPADGPARIGIGPGLDLAGLLGDRPLALADPDHVPAGLYAVEALSQLGAWPLASGRTAYTGHVRAALALVERGEAAAGIVYATDAAIVPRVRVLGTFPPGSHAPIRYPLAIVAGRGSTETAAFHAFLQSPEAAARFRARGFTLPGKKGKKGSGKKGSESILGKRGQSHFSGFGAAQGTDATRMRDRGGSKNDSDPFFPKLTLTPFFPTPFFPGAAF